MAADDKRAGMANVEVHETGTHKKLTQAELDAVRLADYQDALEQIANWCKAYPLAVFPEPTIEEWAQADAALKDAGLQGITRFSASNMRQVVEGVAGIVARALP